MKKKILILVAVIAVIIFIIIKIQGKDIIFMNNYTNYANGHVEFGYYIYSNGVIQEFDCKKESSELKHEKINKEELKQLKELINHLEDKYENYDEENYWNTLVIDGGTTTKCVYTKENVFVLLDGEGSNSSQESIEIREFTEKLYKKYINNKI